MIEIQNRTIKQSRFPGYIPNVIRSKNSNCIKYKEKLHLDKKVSPRDIKYSAFPVREENRSSYTKNPLNSV